MAEILSYGEDALTYWVLTQRLTEFLGKVADRSPAGDALVLYRPSFGRGGAAKGVSAGNSRRSEFGEFDAILRTRECLYLIEAKWSRSSEQVAGTILVRPQQVLRHKILRWHLQRWRSSQAEDWRAFREANAAQFESHFEGYALAPHRSILGRNLEFVLRRLSGGPERIRDILLHIGMPGCAPPQRVEPPEFELVHIEAEVLGPEGYFRLQ